MELAFGDKTKLVYVLMPEYAEGNITFSSSNPGVANVTTIGEVTAVSVGTANVTITFEGNKNYEKTTKTIKVKLLNKFGYAPGKGKVIKFTVNGKSYTAKTNANGIAKLKLPSLAKGVYTVKYKFSGNSFYKASSTSSKVTIITTQTPTFTVKSGTTFTYGKSNTFQVAVTAASVPIIGKQVTFNVDGKSYTKTTNANGIASLPIDLVIGKHTITYSIAKDSKLNAKTGSSAVTIKEKAVNTHNAYWLYGSDMKSVNLQTLASKGVTDILLNFKAYELYGKSHKYNLISVGDIYLYKKV